jgi:hypothetical protein
MGIQASKEDQLLAVLNPIVSELKALRKRVAEVEAKPEQDPFILTLDNPALELLRKELVALCEQVTTASEALVKQAVPSREDIENLVDGAIERFAEQEHYDNVGEVAILGEKLALVSEDMNKQLSAQDGVIRAEIAALNEEVNSNLNNKLNSLVSKEVVSDLISSRLDAFVQTGLLAKSEDLFSIKKEIDSAILNIGNLLDEVEHLHGKLNSLPSQTEIGDRVIAFLKDSREEDMREVRRILEIN